MKFVLIFVLLLPFVARAGEPPASLIFWTQLGQYYSTLSFTDEKMFKQALKNYYAKIYSGEELNKWDAWIDQGSLESDYYASYYEDLKDTKSGDVETYGKHKYGIKTQQKSCYSLGYNPPILESLVADYKVTNCTQLEVDEWYEVIAAEDYLAEICLHTQRLVTFKLDKKDQYIVDENWNILDTKISLFSKSNQAADTKIWCK